MATPIKAYNKKQLAELYSINRDTLTNWLEPFKDKIGKKNGAIYTPKQVKVIFEYLGEP